LSSTLVSPDAGIELQEGNKSYNLVLEEAGATIPIRDEIDKRIISEVKNRTGKIIDSPIEVGGYPIYKSGISPLDTDNDGIPDDWENAHGLNPQDPTDGNKDRDKDGYTNIEEYLNELAGDNELQEKKAQGCDMVSPQNERFYTYSPTPCLYTGVPYGFGEMSPFLTFTKRLSFVPLVNSLGSYNSLWENAHFMSFGVTTGTYWRDDISILKSNKILRVRKIGVLDGYSVQTVTNLATPIQYISLKGEGPVALRLESIDGFKSIYQGKHRMIALGGVRRIFIPIMLDEFYSKDGDGTAFWAFSARSDLTEGELERENGISMHPDDAELRRIIKEKAEEIGGN